jgi:hypothetical protein
MDEWTNAQGTDSLFRGLVRGEDLGAFHGRFASLKKLETATKSFHPKKVDIGPVAAAWKGWHDKPR